MNLIALPSEIVNKIFSFLDPYDVYNCKFVCPLWESEATRWLGKCQAIETFSFSEISAKLPSRGIYGRVDDERERYPEQYGIMLESLISNRLMNKEMIFEDILERNQMPYTVHKHYLHWCYYKEKNEYRQILRPDLDIYVETSLVNSQRDYLFAFVTLKNRLETGVKLSQIFPYSSVANSLMIEQILNPIELGDEILDFERSSFEKIPKAPYPFKYKISIQKELNAFNINQWATQTKIISTNWESGHSLSYEDLYDPDYPIKSLICFKTTPSSCERLEFFVKNKDIIASDVVLNRWSTLYIRSRKWFGESNPQILSIAFAGKNVKAATLSIESLDSTTRAEQLMSFQKSLDFPVNDGRTVGFVFIGNRLFEPNVRSEILISIHKTIPGVNFMDISCWEPRKFPTVLQGLVEGIRIHLVHL